MIERGKIFAESAVAGVLKDVEDLKTKLNAFKDLEKNIKKKFREMAEGNDWQSAWGGKANQEEVRKEFTHMDEKVRNLLELVN